MAALRPARTFAIWVLAHGLGRRFLRGAARRGDLVARLQVDPELAADPFPAYAELRARGPLVLGPQLGATASHAVATEVLRNPAFGTFGAHGELPSRLQRALVRVQDPWSLGVVDPPSMLATDPPVHTRYRRLATREFTARAASGLEPRMEELAARLLDQVAADGGSEVDLVERYAARLPVAVIADVLGVPDRMHEQLLVWGNAAALYLEAGLSWSQYRTAERGMRAMHAWFDDHLALRRREPGNDLLSRLATLDGEDRLTDLELHATGLLVLGAGFETTVNLLGNAVGLLSAHPEQRDRLVADETGWDNAVEEVLRHDSPVQMTGRIARADTEVAGRRVRNGTPVFIALGGANRDPEVFADPDRFDVTRPNAADHLAFSSGPHYCLGANLARREGVVALRALYRRFPDLTTTGTPTRRGTRVLRGFEHLPVRPGAAQPR